MTMTICNIKRRLAAACCALWAASAAAQTVTSPDGNIVVDFSLNGNGVPTYKINYKNKAVVKPSTLGLELNEENSLMDSFRINNTSTSSFDETWQPVWGD